MVMRSRATDRRSASKCQGKWPDQTLDQALGLPEVLVAVGTSRLSCKRAGKTRTLMPLWDSSGESRLKRNREQDPRHEVRMLRTTGIIYPRDAYLAALPTLTVQDIAAYAHQFLARGPVSVVYEGKMAPEFPDHAALAANWATERAPSRTAATDSRVTDTLALKHAHSVQ